MGAYSSVNTFVFYLALGIAVAGGQASPQETESQPTDKQSIHPKLSAAEVSKLRASAEAGDASAQFNLGKAYEYGNGVLKNDESAVKWYRKAADQGNPDAENRLGVMYRLGQGVSRDKEEAVRWYHKAAMQQNPQAMFNLGASYYNGDGVEVDDVMSCAWFVLAQEAGNPAADEAVRRAGSENPSMLAAAFVKVAEMYETGSDFPKNSAEALKWYRTAADAGDARSAVTVAELLLSSGRTLSQAEYAEVRRRCEDTANRKYAPGAYCAGLIRKRGLGVPKDPVESVKRFAHAADLGNAGAALELGEAYWKGDGVTPDLVVAYTWIWLAYSSTVPGAEQDEHALRQEMTPKQVEHAKQKASDWSKSHPIILGLRKRQADSSPPAK
jgi:TPR repeat protein